MEVFRFLDTPNVNESVAIRNKAEYSSAYLAQATNTLFYPDSGTGTASRTANAGVASRAALTNAAGGFNLIVPLNKYSFFAASQNVVNPTGKMELNITLQRDENFLYKDAAAAEGRYVVTKMRLWVPNVELNSAGLNKFGTKLTEKRAWDIWLIELKHHQCLRCKLVHFISQAVLKNQDLLFSTQLIQQKMVM